MSDTPRSVMSEALQKLEEYKSKASTRDHIYHRVSLDTGIPESTLRSAASRAGLTSSIRSLKCAFSEEEEDALVHLCVMRAREGKPFTIPAFVNVANIFAGRTKKGPFLTHSYAYSFLKRHSDSLCRRTGKVTSRKRTYTSMLQKTQEFISLINTHMEGHTMNSSNIVVFDETIIGDNVNVPVVIGERRKSGGGTIHVSYTRELALGCYIPFSMPDGTTPFRVYIFRAGQLKENEGILYALSPVGERELRRVPRMLFLESEKGYLTTAHFDYIMDEFTKWWTESHLGLECFLISDNLRVHTNKDIVAKAMTKGIHMLNIMPGSSHWFQVHDQQPFGGLKKKMSQKKFEFLASTEIPPEERRDLFISLFYQAEKEAFEPLIIRKTFEGVGLWPWNPEKILKMCQEHCPVFSMPLQNSLVNKLLDIVNKVEEEKKAIRCQMLSSLKRVRVVSLKELEMRNAQSKDDAEYSSGDDEEQEARRVHLNTDISVEPPAKRRRIINRSCISCSVKRCKKTHFWSKKWVSCTKCHKSFCPLHKNRLQYHKC